MPPMLYKKTSRSDSLPEQYCTIGVVFTGSQNMSQFDRFQISTERFPDVFHQSPSSHILVELAAGLLLSVLTALTLTLLFRVQTVGARFCGGWNSQHSYMKATLCMLCRDRLK